MKLKEIFNLKKTERGKMKSECNFCEFMVEIVELYSNQKFLFEWEVIGLKYLN